MITLCMEASHRVSSVIDNLKFTLLVIISVSAVENTVGVALLISELSVISYSSIITKSVTMRSSLTMNLERNLLWLIVGFPLVSCCSSLHRGLKISLMMRDWSRFTEIVVLSLVRHLWPHRRLPLVALLLLALPDWLRL